MKIGKLDRRIVIENFSVTGRNAANEEIKSWATYKTVWAQLIEQRGDERFAAAQTSAQMARVFRIRNVSGITEKMRILFEGKYHNIKGISPGGTRQRGFIDLLAVRQDGAGAK